MNRGRILAAGIGGCLLSLAGIVLSIVLFARQGKETSAVLAEPVRLGVCVLGAGEEYKEERITGLFPGESVERETAVVLEEGSADAYIRVRIGFGGILGEPEEESAQERDERSARARELEKGIIFCEGWLEGEDGFYYYQNEAACGSVIPVYRWIVIPESWDNSIAEKMFTVELSAQAVRADCLEPWLEDEKGERRIVRWNYRERQN